MDEQSVFYFVMVGWTLNIAALLIQTIEARKLNLPHVGLAAFGMSIISFVPWLLVCLWAATHIYVMTGVDGD